MYSWEEILNSGWSMLLYEIRNFFPKQEKLLTHLRCIKDRDIFTGAEADVQQVKWVILRQWILGSETSALVECSPSVVGYQVFLLRDRL